MMLMRFFSDFLFNCICCGYPFELHQQVNAIQMGTHNNCICCGYSFELHRQVDAIQMGTHNICLCKDVDKTYTGWNLITMELLDCAHTGVCAVIRLNTVFYLELCKSQHLIVSFY